MKQQKSHRIFDGFFVATVFVSGFPNIKSSINNYCLFFTNSIILLYNKFSLIGLEI